MAFHPTGDYLVVGTNQPVVRLYDTNTAQCYVCSFPSHYHTNAITSLKYRKSMESFHLEVLKYLYLSLLGILLMESSTFPDLETAP